jgi:hypothetical protein
MPSSTSNAWSRPIGQGLSLSDFYKADPKMSLARKVFESHRAKFNTAPKFFASMFLVVCGAGWAIQYTHRLKYAQQHKYH